MSEPRYCGRFAPSPTGPLHAGSLYTAVASWLLARHAGGHWIIRVEDVDRDRCVPGAAEHQLATLAAFGMTSDREVVWQSRRGSLYQAALEQLLRSGQAFVCGCSRAQLAATGGLHQRCIAPPRADGRNAVRLRVASSGLIGFQDGLMGHHIQDLATEVGDVVLHRADGCWAYQMAVVVDDAHQGITDVVRGADLLDSTARQIWLQRCLGLPHPRYLHLPLLTDADGRKLSKSEAACPVSTDNALPMLQWMWQLLGQRPEVVADCRTPTELLQRGACHFQPKRLPHSLPATPTMTSHLPSGSLPT